MYNYEDITEVHGSYTAMQCCLSMCDRNENGGLLINILETTNKN